MSVLECLVYILDNLECLLFLDNRECFWVSGLFECNECPEVSLSVWSISWMILSVLERPWVSSSLGFIYIAFVELWILRSTISNKNRQTFAGLSGKRLFDDALAL